MTQKVWQNKTNLLIYIDLYGTLSATYFLQQLYLQLPDWIQALVVTISGATAEETYPLSSPPIIWRCPRRCHERWTVAFFGPGQPRYLRKCRNGRFRYGIVPDRQPAHPTSGYFLKTRFSRCKWWSVGLDWDFSIPVIVLLLKVVDCLNQAMRLTPSPERCHRSMVGV